MNTAPQMILALLQPACERRACAPQDITVCDTLAYLVHEYYDLLHGAFPAVRYEDYAGKFERVKVKPSDAAALLEQPPAGQGPGLPAHLLRRGRVPDQLRQPQGPHRRRRDALRQEPLRLAGPLAGASRATTTCTRTASPRRRGIYRPLVDLMGHAHLGGKTVLYLVDGLFSGVHPRDPVPQRMQSAPFNGQWSCSLLASQDPVAIDSVGFDFLWREWPDFAAQGRRGRLPARGGAGERSAVRDVLRSQPCHADQAPAQPGRPRALEQSAGEEILAQSGHRRGHRAGQCETGLGPRK